MHFYRHFLNFLVKTHIFHAFLPTILKNSIKMHTCIPNISTKLVKENIMMITIFFVVRTRGKDNNIALRQSDKVEKKAT